MEGGTDGRYVDGRRLRQALPHRVRDLVATDGAGGIWWRRTEIPSVDGIRGRYSMQYACSCCGRSSRGTYGCLAAAAALFI
jgi:hypothetical protein